MQQRSAKSVKQFQHLYVPPYNTIGLSLIITMLSTRDLDGWCIELKRPISKWWNWNNRIITSHWSLIPVSNLAQEAHIHCLYIFIIGWTVSWTTASFIISLWSLNPVTINVCWFEMTNPCWPEILLRLFTRFISMCSIIELAKIRIVLPTFMAKAANTFPRQSFDGFVSWVIYIWYLQFLKWILRTKLYIDTEMWQTDLIFL